MPPDAKPSEGAVAGCADANIVVAPTPKTAAIIVVAFIKHSVDPANYTP
jgi:hypothetical protein